MSFKSNVTRGPFRVLIVSPPIEASGGIGRMVQYELSELAKVDEWSVEVLDSRGAGTVLRSFAVAALCAVRLVCNRNYDLVHFNTSSRASVLRKALIALVVQMSKRPYVIHLHGSGFDEHFARSGWITRSFVKRYFRRSARVIVLGQFWAEFVVRELGVDSDRVKIIPNTAPGPRATPSKIADGTLRVVFLGNLGPRKGSALAIEAVARIGALGIDAHLDIAGDGPKGDLQSLAKSLNANVSFHGWLSAREVSQLLAGSDVLVLPSVAENQPLSVIEAMAHGVVPIATPVGAVGDLIENGASGLILRERSADALAGLLCELSDAGVRGRLASQARRKWAEDLRPEWHVARLCETWQAALVTAQRDTV